MTRPYHEARGSWRSDVWRPRSPSSGRRDMPRATQAVGAMSGSQRKETSSLPIPQFTKEERGGAAR